MNFIVGAMNYDAVFITPKDSSPTDLPLIVFPHGKSFLFKFLFDGGKGKISRLLSSSLNVCVYVFSNLCLFHMTGF